MMSISAGATLFKLCTMDAIAQMVTFYLVHSQSPTVYIYKQSSVFPVAVHVRDWLACWNDFTLYEAIYFFLQNTWEFTVAMP